ncbi:MAG TPA: CSLREA domain-containing protein, partial [Pyrinomonadaceae bacterium]|nr:CSLREA domain-containing protein [Pyrinomonadaceae bacterium]
MSPAPIRRVRIRALFVISLCTVLVTIGSVWASRQQAGAPSRQRSSRFSTTPFLVPDKGSIVPEASTITVNSTSDVANGTDGLCTLREAITAANSNAASGVTAGECAAGSGGSDTINLATLTGTINLTAALPDITSSMTITGPGSAQLTVRRDTGGDYRIFTVTGGVVSISGLTVTNGKAAIGPPANSGGAGSGGGGILNSGTLTLTDVTVTANEAGAGGLGITGTGGAGGNGGGISNNG